MEASVNEHKVENLPAEQPHQTQEEMLYSYEMTEIISKQPHWIVRRAMPIFFGLLVVFVVISGFIQYPEVIVANSKIVAVNAPKLCVAKQSGKLLKIIVKSGERVLSGQHIAYMHDVANVEQVLKLSAWIDNAERALLMRNISVIQKNPMPMLNELGEIQQHYSAFQIVTEQTKDALANGIYEKKKQALFDEMERLKKLEENTQRQKALSEEELKLQAKDLTVKQMLADEKIIAPNSMNEEMAKLLNKKKAVELAEAEMIAHELNKAVKRTSLIDIEQAAYEKRRSFSPAFYELKSKVDEWIDKFVIKAPDSGTVRYASFLEENQWINANQELFYVVADDDSYYVELAAKHSNVGKIRPGQEVILKANSYPYQEFGVLKGKVGFISNIPVKDSVFLVKVDLQQGLTTTYNKKLFFYNNLNASSEIIIKNRTILQSILGKIYTVFK